MPFNLPIIPVLGVPGGGKTTFCKWMSDPKIQTPFGKTLKVHHILLTHIMRDRLDEMPARLRDLFVAGGSLNLNDPEVVDYTLELLYEQLQCQVIGRTGACSGCGEQAITGDMMRGQVVIVDGFPRCRLAAQRFEAQFGLPLAVIEFRVDEEIAVERAINRARDDRDEEHTARRRIARSLHGNKEIKSIWKERGELPWMTVDTSRNKTHDDFLPVWRRLMDCVWFQNLWVPSKAFRPRC